MEQLERQAGEEIVPHMSAIGSSSGKKKEPRGKGMDFMQRTPCQVPKEEQTDLPVEQSSGAGQATLAEALLGRQGGEQQGGATALGGQGEQVEQAEGPDDTLWMMTVNCTNLKSDSTSLWRKLGQSTPAGPESARCCVPAGA